MNFKSLLIIPLGLQMGWSAITLTMQDPTQKPIPGVSCSQAGSAVAVSDAQGVVVVSNVSGIIPLHQSRNNTPLFNIPMAAGENASLIIFDSKGKKVADRNLRFGEEFKFSTPNPGVYHFKVSGHGLTISQSVVSFGNELTFTGASFDASNAPVALRKSEAVASVTCSKTGYATKVFDFTDGDTKTVGFGVPISRPFSRTDYPLIPGFNLEIAEDFTSSNWPNGLAWAPGTFNSNDTVWEPSDGGFADNQVRFNPANIAMKNDGMYLIISQGSQPSSVSHSESANCDGVTADPFCGTKMAPARNLAGGEVRTRNNHFRFGRYEVNIDPPDRGPGPGTADGFIAAMFTWFTPRDTHWRENDVEVLGNKTDTYLTNIFFTNKASQWQNTFADDNVKTTPPAGYDPRKPHTYAVEWLPATVKWFVDGNLVRTFPPHIQTYSQGVEISQMSTKIIMNFWILNADIGGVGANNVYPIETKFDNFRYYRWDQDGDKKTYPETVCLSTHSNNCAGL